MVGFIIGIIAISLFVIAAICNSVMDTLKDHFDTSIFSSLKNQKFWNPRISWENKWKKTDEGTKEKFLGSSTVFVWTTDAWHLFQFFMLTCIQGSISLLYWSLLNVEWWWLIIMIASLKIVWGLYFEYFYKYVWIKKKD